MIKTLLTALTLTTLATPVLAQSDMSQHQQLWNAVESTGVSISLNKAEYCYSKFNGGKKFFGFYYGPTRLLVICQEAALRTDTYNQGQLQWSEEDFDTLRHEAHHLVQDCRDKELNQELDTVYTKPVNLAMSVLGRDGVMGVLQTYSDASEEMKVLELEAFSVARMNQPLEQVNDIKTYCF